LVGQDLRTGQLVQVLPDYQAPDSAIYAVYPPGRHLSAKVRSFIDFLVERFGGKDAWWRDTDA
jgi:DNA-binding transcriptional LysR family regulator